ncbi:chemotaxis protein CheW [Neptunicella marina]|uniref:Chemotaxis protein CheW n=1 Tax=Neptunicella marina TaxID=2125989 RepID=A0A8J6M310_9ALTE|nr:chemotaxis protein CheW [Neptunicella marina]MBC3764976.1 chemotaxis protein CheW [Neptunicella marina]
MSKSAFAKEEVMEEYFASLLTEDNEEAGTLVEKSQLDQLLSKVGADSEVEKQVKVKPVIEQKVVESVKEISSAADINQEEPLPVSEPVAQAELAYRQGTFQALFFQLAGLTMAVPLTELGGIHQLDKTNPLFGKPDWFIGVMLHREEQLSVIDTAKWVMPERLDQKLAESIKYQYLIMLGESHWGLACEKLVNTVTLHQDDVKWRENDGKRPWLAGLVKDRMCALIDVQQMIAMLNHN